MEIQTKANPVASVDKAPIALSAEATFIDGLPLTPEGGGIVNDKGQLYSVARSDMVPKGQLSESIGQGWAIPANRIGKIAILANDQSQPTTYGAELEFVRLGADGTYADFDLAYLLKVNELYSFMGESGTHPTDDPEEFERRLWAMIHEEVDRAEAAGQYMAALAVFGQYEPRPDQINPSIYVQDVSRAMSERTGFETTAVFRTGSAQMHTGVSDTFAALQALEAMQYLSPILLAPTLSGPLLNDNPVRTQFTDRQLAHLNEVGLKPRDFGGSYQSWRYLLRRTGSPSAGVWHAPPPSSPGAYLQAAHQGLAAGQINNPDRANGWHTDRLRIVLDGKGANTTEDCSADPMLGNVPTLSPLKLLRSALTTRFEAMAMKGQDPREAVARMLGTVGLSRQMRLDLAHDISLRAVSRQGNDARTYKDHTPGHWLPALLTVAEEAPYTRLTSAQQARLRGMYATWGETTGHLRQWCRDNGADMPTTQAYFDLGINNPAVYMLAEYRGLRSQRPHEPRPNLVRRIELNAAQALHRASRLVREAA